MTSVGLGLHATKARWVDSTIRAGLDRPSAAWFLIDRTPQVAPRLTTFAAAVYLALAPSGRAALAVMDGPEVLAYQVFARRPELLPVLLAFDEMHADAKTRHRYVWLGSRPPTATATTDAYTKVERAGRIVSAPLPVAVEFRISVDDVAATRSGLRPAGASWADDEPLLRRIEPDAAGGSVERRATNIADICMELGQLLWTRWNDHFGLRTTGQGSDERLTS
jgi:hypothetical protein